MGSVAMSVTVGPATDNGPEREEALVSGQRFEIGPVSERPRIRVGLAEKWRRNGVELAMIRPWFGGGRV